jgi:nitroreductase
MINESELIKIQEWRCSVKKFDSKKKIPQTTWSAIEKALVLSPSSYGLQPWKFLVVTNPEIRRKLTPLSWGQSQVEDCSHFVVFAFRNKMDEAYVEKYVKAIMETRALPAEKLEAYKNMMVGDIVKGPRSAKVQEWASRQVYIALGNFMTSAAMVGVDTCPMEGIDPAKYDEVLGLAGTEYSTVVACAAGYRDAEDAYSKLKKVRFSSAELVKNI